MSGTDFELSGSGTIYLLTPITSDARDWVQLHIPADAQRLGSAVAIEWRFVDDIVQGIDDDGLTVERT